MRVDRTLNKPSLPSRSVPITFAICYSFEQLLRASGGAARTIGTLAGYF